MDKKFEDKNDDYVITRTDGFLKYVKSEDGLGISPLRLLMLIVEKSTIGNNIVDFSSHQRAELVKNFELTTQSFYNNVKLLYDKGLLIDQKRGRYVYNPVIFLKGNISRGDLTIMERIWDREYKKAQSEIKEMPVKRGLKDNGIYVE